ncbi:hypothetical protein [Streptomyces sp. H39-C1]|nr:hypothetical protein [Streptomyces sp. H39-C1]MCZ4100252.1 hypothetical protein [Streptomyces sp. H39-C1]
MIERIMKRTTALAYVATLGVAASFAAGFFTNKFLLYSNAVDSLQETVCGDMMTSDSVKSVLPKSHTAMEHYTALGAGQDFNQSCIISSGTSGTLTIRAKIQNAAFQDWQKWVKGETRDDGSGVPVKMGKGGVSYPTTTYLYIPCTPRYPRAEATPAKDSYYLQVNVRFNGDADADAGTVRKAVADAAQAFGKNAHSEAGCLGAP